MALAIVATKTAPDTYRFDVTGVDLAAAPTIVFNYGDTSAPETVTTDPDGTTTRSHTYTDPGHHTYTVTVTAAQTPYATTLAQIDTKLMGPAESMWTVNPATASSFAGEWGQRFTVRRAGIITAIKFYRWPGATPTARTVTLWNWTTQAALGTGQTTAETGSGWFTVPLSTPVRVTPGDYVASYGSTAGPVALTVPSPAQPSTVNLTGITARSGPIGQFPNANNANATHVDVVYQPSGTLADLAAVPGLSTLADIPRTQVTATATAVTVDVGPATIDATVKAASPVPQVQVDVWIGNPASVASWVVYRETPDEVVPIRTQATTSGAETFIDYMAPLGVPIFYRLVITYTSPATSPYSVTDGPVTITGTTGCFLTSPATGATLRTTLATWPDQTFEERQAVLEVLARPDPVVLSDVHTTAAGQWTFYTATDTERRALLDLLRAQRIVVLRSQPTASIDTVTAAVGRIVERRYSGAGWDQRRWIEVDHQVIGSLPATTLPYPASLDGLNRMVPGTLADLNGLRATLLQLSMVETG